MRTHRPQSEKIKTDPDYRKNQHESHRYWIEQNRDYYQRCLEPFWRMPNYLTDG